MDVICVALSDRMLLIKHKQLISITALEYTIRDSEHNVGS